MKIMILGEAMLEYRSAGQSRDGLHYGGDTLNTAVHMARLGCAVSYVTALGCDPLSEALIADWEREGLDTRLVLRHPERHPGIYAIHLDARGERSFLYWRDRSAARELFSLASIDTVVEAIAQADLFYFSHISLAVLPPAGRAALISAAERVRAKRGLVAYDSNFRPRLWKSHTSARIWSDRATAVAAIGLPTLEDELALHGMAANAEQIANRWHELGCAEVVIKRGGDGPLLSTKGASAIAYPCEQVAMIDSSGAGDAFNAGYLAARMQKKHPPEAVQAGHALAAWVITQPGALPSPSADAPYDCWQGTGARVATAKV